MSSSTPQQLQPQQPQQIKMDALFTQTDGQHFDDDTIEQLVKIETGVDLPDFQAQDEVLVRVQAVGLGFTDVACLRTQKASQKLGMDFSGIVHKAGPTTQWKAGDYVCGFSVGGLGASLTGGEGYERYRDDGAFATFVRARSVDLVRLPESVTFESGAAISSATFTAFQALSPSSWPFQAADHDPILVVGGHTIVGLAALQLGKLLGYRMLATVPARFIKLAESYGAEKAYDYTSSDLIETLKKDTQNDLKYAMDAVSEGSSLLTAYQAIGSGGGFIQSVYPREGGKAQAVLSVKRADVKIQSSLPVTLFGFEAEWQGQTYRPAKDEVTVFQKAVRTLGDWLDKGTFKPFPIQIGPRCDGLIAIPQALQALRVEKHHAGHKVVIAVDGNSA